MFDNLILLILQSNNLFTETILVKADLKLSNFSREGHFFYNPSTNMTGNLDQTHKEEVSPG